MYEVRSDSKVHELKQPGLNLLEQIGVKDTNKNYQMNEGNAKICITEKTRETLAAFIDGSDNQNPQVLKWTEDA